MSEVLFSAAFLVQILEDAIRGELNEVASMPTKYIHFTGKLFSKLRFSANLHHL